jgi:hypothetical protein
LIENQENENELINSDNNFIYLNNSQLNFEKQTTSNKNRKRKRNSFGATNLNKRYFSETNNAESNPLYIVADESDKFSTSSTIYTEFVRKNKKIQYENTSNISNKLLERKKSVPVQQTVIDIIDLT